MVAVYPLIFLPILKPKIWGGRKLETSLSKKLPAGERIGESWELADLENGQSVVASGPARGKTLGELVRTWGAELMGGTPLVDGRFPLLIKFLDAAEPLSVQVHPDLKTAQRLGGNVRLKHEAWYIIDAPENGFIYRGLRKGVNKQELSEAIQEGCVESVLCRHPARPGYCYYLPSGTVHALGGGVSVAEVQTPSDITYRIYDWNRTDPSTGKPRELHVAEALSCISYDSSSMPEEQRQHVASLWTAVTRLVRCASFVIERVRMVEGIDQQIPYEELVIWIVLEGRGSIVHAGPTSPTTFGVGDTVLIPAGLKKGRVQTHTDCMWLEVSVPIPSTLAGFEHPQPFALEGPSAKYVSLNVPRKPE